MVGRSQTPNLEELQSLQPRGAISELLMVQDADITKLCAASGKVLGGLDSPLGVNPNLEFRKKWPLLDPDKVRRNVYARMLSSIISLGDGETRKKFSEFEKPVGSIPMQVVFTDLTELAETYDTEPKRSNFTSLGAMLLRDASDWSNKMAKRKFPLQTYAFFSAGDSIYLDVFESSPEVQAHLTQKYLDPQRQRNVLHPPQRVTPHLIVGTGISAELVAINFRENYLAS